MSAIEIAEMLMECAVPSRGDSLSCHMFLICSFRSALEGGQRAVEITQYNASIPARNGSQPLADVIPHGHALLDQRSTLNCLICSLFAGVPGVLINIENIQRGIQH